MGLRITFRVRVRVKVRVRVRRLGPEGYRVSVGSRLEQGSRVRM